MAFTKVVGPGIHTLSNIASHNINSSGIITATKFVGPFDNINVGGATTLTVDGINISAGILTAKTLDLNGNGDISGNLVIGGNLTANGDFTTLNTTLREVELLRVDAQDNNVAAGIITQRGTGNILDLYDTNTKIFSVKDGGDVIAGVGDLETHTGSRRRLAITDTNNGALLHIRGQSPALFFDQSGGNISKIYQDNVDLAIYANRPDSEGANTVRITGGGGVGIGTVSPDHNLHVHNSSGDSIVTIESTGNGSHSALEFVRSQAGGDSKGAGSIYVTGDTSATEAKMKFAVGHNVDHQYRPNMVLMGNGEVGIGTDNPGSLLEVYGTGTSTQVEVNGTGRYRGFEIHEAGTRKAYFHHDATNNEAILNTAEANLQFHTGDTPRMKLDGNGDLTFKDGSAQGNSLQSMIRVTDSSSNIQYEIGMLSTGNEDLYFSNSRNSNIRFRTQAITRWKIDGTGHLLPETAGAVNIGSATAEIGDIYFANSKGLKLGSNQAGDLYNDGTDTYFRNSASNGQMLIRSNGNILISNYAADEYRIKTFNNGAVELYYDQSAHATAKLATTAKGVSVHGEVAASQDFPVIKPVLDFNFAAEKKLDPRFTFYRRGTASYVDKKGIVRYATNNEPRFDHHPTTGASLGFLVEKQQSNYQPYSVDMSQGANNNAVTVVNDAAISPDGTKNASKIIGSDNQNTSQRLGWGTQTVPNNSYTMWSIWLKSEETSCIIQVYSNTYTFGADHLNVELADGTTGGHNNNDGTFRYNLEKYPNKWWRLSWGGNGNGGTGGMYVAVVPAIDSARAANTGAAHSKVWYAWGLQEEVSTESRIATSYIPTYGSTATRYGDYAQMQDDDFDDFFDRFQGTVINEHSNALQSYGGGGSGWEFQNNQFQTNLITSTGSGYAANAYPGAHASVFGDRGSNGSGNGSGSDYIQAYGPNDADAQNAPANTGNGRYPSNNIPDYTRYYRTWIDAMSYDVTPSENILRVATGGASSYVGGNTQNISLANISKLEIGNGASQLGYSSIYGRIKRWVYYDKVLPLSQLRNLTAQLPQSYL